MVTSKYNVIVEYKDKLLLYNALNHSFSYLHNCSNSKDLINDFLKLLLLKKWDMFMMIFTMKKNRI